MDGDDVASRPPIYKTIGIILAIASGVFIGISFVLKKVGLLRANAKYNEEAGEGYGYLKNFAWWAGMTLMIIGEVCNFVAYAFTDAILVTPLGALSVVVTTILSAIVLKERLSFVGYVGCFICIIGSIIIVMNAPEQAAVSKIQEMQRYVIAPGFLTYGGIIIVGCILVIFLVAPKWGKKSMMVYLTICSTIGGLSVVATQGLGAAIIAQINGTPQFNQWFLYVLFAFVIVTLLTEIVYLNKALNIYNAALVTPTYYVFFTSCTIISSAILFQGFNGTTEQIVDVVMGFLVICSGVILLQLAKSSKDVPDAQLLKGDLNQIRTVAEQEEPEYEPRADAIRGGAGIVRALSRVRTQKGIAEAKRLHDELNATANDPAYEWDGLRRRKTVSTARTIRTVSRHELEPHPPLGMSRFPDEDVSDPESDVHPGFFGRIGKSIRKTRQGSSAIGTTSSRANDAAANDEKHAYNFVAPAGLDGDEQSPSRRGTPSHIHFAQDVRNPTYNGMTPPPPVPKHGNRQFSFTNIMQRIHSGSHSAPTLTGQMREDSNIPKTTEEERLGLVHGDSRKDLPRYDEKLVEGSERSSISSDASSACTLGSRALGSNAAPGVTPGRRVPSVERRQPFAARSDDDEGSLLSMASNDSGTKSTGSVRITGRAFV